MRGAAIALLVALALAGCTAGWSAHPDPVVAPATAADTDAGAARADAPVRCTLLTRDRSPVPGGACAFAFDGASMMIPVDDQGVAVQAVRVGATGQITGSARGFAQQTLPVSVDGPVAIEMTLDRLADATLPPRENALEAPVPPALRRWSAPVAVSSVANEPHVVGAPDGTLYFAPISQLWRSVDGGASWSDVTPRFPTALPTLASDTSVSIAPDGSVWFAIGWGYAGGTIACASATRGDTWICDNAAIPGATDRMWIVGVSAEEGYVQTNVGFYQHVWARSRTGSASYAAHATTTQTLLASNGNLVVDDAGALFQIEAVGVELHLWRIGAGPLLESTPTGIPSAGDLPHLEAAGGALWTVGTARDGDRDVPVLGVSLDGGRSWRAKNVATSAASIAFPTVAASASGRVAIAFYGSDEVAARADGGTWSIRVVETNDALDEFPAWLETTVVPRVHEGALCAGAGCETVAGEDSARFAGDLMGAWMDPAGNVHVAYTQDTPERPVGSYVRQHVA